MEQRDCQAPRCSCPIARSFTGADHGLDSPKWETTSPTLQAMTSQLRPGKASEEVSRILGLHP